jgi:hypothetical protein
VGLEKSRAAAGRAAKASRERAVKARGESAGVVDMSSEEPNTGMPLMALCCNWNSMGIIVNIGGNFEQPTHGLPADTDDWARVIRDDG